MRSETSSRVFSVLQGIVEKKKEHLHIENMWTIFME